MLYTPLPHNGGGRVQNAGSVLARRSVPWRALGALVLGALLAKWSWALFAPHAAAVAVAPPREPSAEAGRLFGVAASGVRADGGAVLANARLVGVFAPAPGKSGFAVLKLDDKEQVGLALGESTPSGAKLVEIHPGYVVLERAGARQRVELEDGTAQAKQ